MQSEQLDQLWTALSAAQAEFEAVAKESLNPFFKSRYAALPDVVKYASPILAKHGLSVAQFPDGDDGLVTYLAHQSGQFVAHRIAMHLTKTDPQGFGAAVTYYRRYGYMSALGLVADEDDDGNSQAATTFTRPAPARVESPKAGYTGQVVSADPAISRILEAAQRVDDEFLTSLATQFQQRGRLTEKQIAAGTKKADTVLGKQPEGEAALSAISTTVEQVPWPDEEPF